MSQNKILHINIVIQQYFGLNNSVRTVPAKDLMSYFIKAGIFKKDEKNGLPIRNLLRQLDRKNQLSQIPFVIPERKRKNTYWYFGRTVQGILPKTAPKAVPVITKVKQGIVSGGRKESDEHYVIDLCDQVLVQKGSRQHRFSFLIGDSGRKLPVDVYYESLNLVIEFNEQQHTKSVKHFDKPDKLTVSGVHRGEQRKIYDKRKRTILPKNGIRVIDISYTAFQVDGKGKIIRDVKSDLEIVRSIIEKDKN